jgi:pyridoxine kinase
VFLSRYLDTRDVKKTLELTAASVYGILEATYREGQTQAGKAAELFLIGAQKELTEPSSFFEAEKL